MNLKSKLIDKIVNLNLDYVYHRQSLVKGYNYYKERVVISMYSPRFEELIAYVQGTNVYCVHMFLRGNSFVNNCTCPVSQNCKHVIACLYEIRNDYSLYDTETSTNDNDFKLNKDPSFGEMMKFLKRLVGPKYILNYFVDGDFRIYYRRILEKIRIEIKDGQLIALEHLSEVINFASKITYHASANFHIEIAKDIYPLVELVIQIGNNDMIDALTKSTDSKGMDILIDCLSKYEEDHMANDITSKLLDRIISYVKDTTGIVSDKVNIMIANNYLLHNPIKFRQFARNNINVGPIRQMLVQSLYYDKRYEEIVELYKDITPESAKEYTILIASKKALNEDIEFLVDSFLLKYASVENIKMLKGLGVDEKIIDLAVLNAISIIPDEKMRINAMLNMGYKDEVDKLISKLKPKDALQLIHSNFKALIKDPTDSLFKFYQKILIDLYYDIDHKFLSYLDDFDSMPFSVFYKVQVIKELERTFIIDDYTTRYYIRNIEYGALLTE